MDWTKLIGVIRVMFPSIVKLVQALIAHQNPDDPPPTSAEVLEAFRLACVTSLAEDEEWLAAHPPEQV